MRLLVDENSSPMSVNALREARHDVVATGECSPGISAAAVMAVAHDARRIVVTFDRDYGQWVFHRRFPEIMRVSARCVTAGIERWN